MTNNHQSGSGDSNESPPRPPLSVENGVEYSVWVPADAVTRYSNLMEAMKTLRIAASEYLASSENTIYLPNQPTTILMDAMTTFRESFRRAHYHDMREEDRESFRYLQEVTLRKTLDHAITLRRELPMANKQPNTVAVDIMAVFRAYDEEYLGRDVVGEEVGHLNEMYQAQLAKLA